MSFITSQQANIQGCKIETPHSDDIRTICGTAMCSGVSDPNLIPADSRTFDTDLGQWLNGNGDTLQWSASYGGSMQLINDFNGYASGVIGPYVLVEGDTYQLGYTCHFITSGQSVLGVTPNSDGNGTSQVVLGSATIGVPAKGTFVAPAGDIYVSVLINSATVDNRTHYVDDFSLVKV